MSLPHLLPKLKTRTRGDVFIIFWPFPVQQILPELDRVFDLLDADPLQTEPVRNYITLVKDVTGDYNGLLPVSLQLGYNVRQPYAINWLQEEDEERATVKVKHAYDLGFDTNPPV